MQSAKNIRVLVVEDEALAGIMMEHFLGDFGYSVVGPIENMQAATLLAAIEQIDVAVVPQLQWCGATIFLCRQ
jgi:CheY-like chemotaxis protein